MIYLDNAATSFIKPVAVKRAVMRAMEEASSPGRGGYREAVRAGEIVFSAREALAELFNIPAPENIVFTQNATAAINTALKGLVGKNDTLVISKMEHNAVARPAKSLSDKGAEVLLIPADKDGFVRPEAMEQVFSGRRVKLACVIHASNVSGSVNDIELLGRTAKKHGALFMVDASQSAGCVPIDVEKMGIDILAFPGHKALLGPQGTGGLYIREGLCPDTLMEGGTGSLSELLTQPDIMPDRFEAGTLNVPGIAGLLAGVRFVLREGVGSIGERERYLTGLLAEDLAEIKGVELIGRPGKAESVGVLSVTVTSGCVEAADRMAAEYAVALRAGLHCAPLAHKSLGTIDVGTLRFSPGAFTTREQIKYAAMAMKRMLK